MTKVLPLLPGILIGVTPIAFNCANVIEVPATEMLPTPLTGDTIWKLPFNISPLPAAFVPDDKSDSNTLPSVFATRPSFKPITAGTPTMLIVNVVVLVSPSPSSIS